MKRQEAVDFVIRELGKHHSQDKIISDLCHNTGMNWVDAAKFVKQVEAEHGHSIAARQSPLVVVIGIISIIIGCVMTIYGASYFIGLIGFMSTSHPNAVDTGLAAMDVAKRAYGRLATLGGGLALMAGSVVGMWQTFKALFKRK